MRRLALGTMVAGVGALGVAAAPAVPGGAVPPVPPTLPTPSVPSTLPAAPAPPTLPTPSVPSSTPAPSVRVDGNHLVNAAGQTVRLLGVDRSGSEYMCLGGSAVFSGPTDDAAVRAMAGWDIDAVRVPLNEDCWLGINGVAPAVSGAAYDKAIERYVHTLEAFGLIVILDLHWAAPGSYLADSQWPMADADHAPAFWSSVATAFKGDHGVVFDLFNEPYITSWSCWRNGCRTSYSDNGTEVAYRTAGMQQLVDAIRSTGATQPLMLGGLDWASDDSGWLAHEPSDPDGQLVASFHTYNFSGCNTLSCWNRTIAPLAQHVPVVTGEIGENDCAHGYIDSYMRWADNAGVSYLGWAWDSTGPPSYWNCSSGPALITNYKGAPTAYGVGLKIHLAQLAAAGRLDGPFRAA